MEKGLKQNTAENTPKKLGFWPKAVALISAATSAMALSCTPPDMSKKTTPQPRKAPPTRIEADCTRQRVVEVLRTVYFSGSKDYVKQRSSECEPGTLKKTGKDEYSCNVRKEVLEDPKCEEGK